MRQRGGGERVDHQGDDELLGIQCEHGGHGRDRGDPSAGDDVEHEQHETEHRGFDNATMQERWKQPMIKAIGMVIPIENTAHGEEAMALMATSARNAMAMAVITIEEDRQDSRRRTCPFRRLPSDRRNGRDAWRRSTA